MTEVMTVNEIKAELDKLGVEYDKRAKKTDLMELLASADSGDADADAEEAEATDEEGVEEQADTQEDAEVAAIDAAGQVRTVCKVYVRDAPGGNIVRTEEAGTILNTARLDGAWYELDDGNYIMAIFVRPI